MTNSKVRNSTVEEKEVWKPVPDYEDYYEVSSFGQVRSIDREVPVYRNGSTHYRRYKGQIINPGIDRYGYKKLNLYHNSKKRKTFTVHRLVAIAFLENPNNLPEINHIDCDKKNNFYKNLDWVTQRENADHAIENGLYVGNNAKEFLWGEDHPNSILTEKKVKGIREDYKNKVGSYAKLSEKYGISKPTVAGIVKRRAWKNI